MNTSHSKASPESVDVIDLGLPRAILRDFKRTLTQSLPNPRLYLGPKALKQKRRASGSSAGGVSQQPWDRVGRYKCDHLEDKAPRRLNKARSPLRRSNRTSSDLQWSNKASSSLQRSNKPNSPLKRPKKTLLRRSNKTHSPKRRSNKAHPPVRRSKPKRRPHRPHPYVSPRLYQPPPPRPLPPSPPPRTPAVRWAPPPPVAPSYTASDFLLKFAESRFSAGQGLGNWGAPALSRSASSGSLRARAPRGGLQQPRPAPQQLSTPAPCRPAALPTLSSDYELYYTQAQLSVKLNQRPNTTGAPVLSRSISSVSLGGQKPARAAQRRGSLPGSPFVKREGPHPARPAQRSQSPRLAEPPLTARLAERPQTPRLAERQQTPRLAERPQTPRLAERPQTPRLAERPQTPRQGERIESPRSVEHSNAPRPVKSPSPRLPERPRTSFLGKRPRLAVTLPAGLPPPLAPVPYCPKSKHFSKSTAAPLAPPAPSPTPRAPSPPARAMAANALEDSDGNDSLSAPSEFLAEFLSAIMGRRYTAALHYCRRILQYEPRNQTARSFYPLLLQKAREERGSDASGNSDSASCDSLSLDSSSDRSERSSRSSSPGGAGARSSSPSPPLSHSYIPTLSLDEERRAPASGSSSEWRLLPDTPPLLTDADDNGNPASSTPHVLPTLNTTDEEDVENENASGDHTALLKDPELSALRVQFACSIK